MDITGLLEVRRQFGCLRRLLTFSFISDDFSVSGQHPLNVGVGIPGPFTVESCLNYCTEYGFTLGGMESGNECCMYLILLP